MHALVRIYMCARSLGGAHAVVVWKKVEQKTSDEGGNPGDNVKYFISPAFVAALLCALSALFEPLIDVFLGKDWNGNSAGNKGVKIHIKSELKIPSSSSVSHPTVDFERCVISFIYFYCWTFLSNSF